MENGTYIGRAKSWALGTTSTGKEQLAVEFEVQVAEGANPEHISYFGFFTEKALERTVESLRHMGWVGDDLSNLTGLDVNEVELVIEAEEYNGTWRPKVKWVNKPGGISLKNAMAPDKAKAFAASMKGRILALGKAPTASKPPAKPSARPAPSPQPSQQPEPPPHGDDDIPF